MNESDYVWFNNWDSLVFRNDLCHLLGAQDSNSTLIEAVWIFLGGDVKVNSEDEVRPSEVQVHGQSHLQREEKLNVMSVSGRAEFNGIITYFSKCRLSDGKMNGFVSCVHLLFIPCVSSQRCFAWSSGAEWEAAQWRWRWTETACCWYK